MIEGYENFILLLDHIRDDHYRARVVDSPGGGGRTDFRLPFSAPELENLTLRGNCPWRDLEAAAPAEVLSVRELGERLFQTVFSGDVETCWRASLALTGASGQGLRLLLLLQDAALMRLPWEYLHDPVFGRSPGMQIDTPIARYLDVAEPSRPLQVVPPIRVLAVLANPRDTREHLEVEEEWQQINAALAPLITAGKVEVFRLAQPSLAALARFLKKKPCHVLHFVGHGTFDRQKQTGALVLEDNHGRAVSVSADKLGALLYAHRGIRLVVLNLCEGGQPSTLDPFGGLAHRLVQQGVPAVVAMQSAVSDRGAIVFAERFYRALAEHAPVDAAVAAARLEMFIAPGHDAEWGVPVLYLRVRDGQLFDFGASQPEPALPSAPRPLLGEPIAARGGWWAWLARVPTFLLDQLAQHPVLILLIVVVAITLRLLDAATPAVSTLEPRKPPVFMVDPACPSPPGLDLHLVRIEAGEFWMGSEDGEKDERPRHRVVLTQSFCIGATEVTQEQWRQVMDADSPPLAAQDADLPKVKVPWDKVQRFLDELNKRDSPGRYRLPTEAEWEYAARAGTDTAYSFDDDAEDLYLFGNCRSGSLMSGSRNDGFDNVAAAVGSFGANPWGLYDVHGNVREWVADWYGTYPEGEVVDPRGPVEGEERVWRGGSFDLLPRNCRSARRYSAKPTAQYKDVGFRVVREVVLPAGS